MKSDEYMYSRLKRQLIDKKNRGCEYAEWSLTQDKVKYIEDVLGFYTEPYIFRITTRTLSRETLKRSGLLKEIHFSRVKGKTRLVKRLNFRDRKLLSECNIYYTPIKYKIHLR